MGKGNGGSGKKKKGSGKKPWPLARAASDPWMAVKRANEHHRSADEAARIALFWKVLGVSFVVTAMLLVLANGTMNECDLLLLIGHSF